MARNKAQWDKFQEHQNVYGWGICARNPADGQPTQLARDFNFCWALTPPKQWIEDIRVRDWRELRSRMAENRVWNGKIHCICVSGANAFWRTSIMTRIWTRSPWCSHSNNCCSNKECSLHTSHLFTLDAYLSSAQACASILLSIIRCWTRLWSCAVLRYWPAMDGAQWWCDGIFETVSHFAYKRPANMFHISTHLEIQIRKLRIFKNPIKLWCFVVLAVAKRVWKIN